MDIKAFTDLNPSPRILLGPGPSMASPRVLRAMSTPLVGHLDPQFLTLMNEVQIMLRYVFQTENEITIPISGTGSAGMEAALCNFIEPGDRVLVAINGYFGGRIYDMAGRYGAVVDKLERPWGEVFDPADIEAALKSKKYKLIAIVHAETSTGALQPGIKEIAAAAHKHGALFLLDTVTSLSGLPVEIDAWDVDISYSGSQKCMSAPPGLSPLTISPRAREVLNKRQIPVANWYLDLTLLTKYWGQERTYHHTAPISMNYALREALRLVVEEGLEARFAPPSRQRRSALARPGSARPAAAGARRKPSTHPDDATHPALGGRRNHPPPPAGRLQYRDRRRVWAAQGSGMAHRSDGIQQPPGKRDPFTGSTPPVTWLTETV